MPDINITGMIVDYRVTCSSCGHGYEYSLDEGDYYYGEEQIENAISSSGELDDWNGSVCPDCQETEEDN